MALFDSSTCTLYTYTRVLLHCEQCFKIQCLGKHAKCSIIQRKEEKKRFYVIDIWYDIRFRDDIFFYSFVVFIEKVFISFTWILVFIIMHISKNEGDFISFFSHLNWNWRRFNLVVSHITWSCTEFRIALDNLVNSFKEIFLCCHFTSGTNSKHTSFCADRPIS